MEGCGSRKTHHITRIGLCSSGGLSTSSWPACTSIPHSLVMKCSRSKGSVNSAPPTQECRVGLWQRIRPPFALRKPGSSSADSIFRRSWIHFTTCLRQPWELGSSSSSPSALQTMVQHHGAVMQQISSQSAAASAAVRAEDV
eukprot:1992343-Amphidinium_carterae.1